MKRTISLFVICLVSLIIFSNFSLYAKESSMEQIHPFLRLSTDDYAKFCTDENTYQVKNFITGETLIYNKNTSAEEIKNIYTAGLSNINYESSPPTLIYKENNEYKVISKNFYNILRISPKSIAMPTIKQQKPYSGICLLRLKYIYNGITDYGYATGFIIGESHIASAAHNFYNNEYAPYLTAIEVYAAFQDSRGGFAYRKYNVQVMDGVVGNQNHTAESDYALLTVDEPLTVHGYYKLNNGENITINKRFTTIGFNGSEIKNQTLRLTPGTPFDPAYINVDPDPQSGTITNVASKTLTASSSVTGAEGLSGSPWFIVKDGDVEVVAILSRNVSGNLTGTRITSNIYNYYNSRVNFNTINENDYIKNISINHPYYFSGEEIKITVLEVPSQTAWVGLYPQSIQTGNYVGNSMGMYCYLETGTITDPSTFINKYNRTVTLTAHIRHIPNMNLIPVQEGYYKIVLFKDSGYTEIANQKFIVDGSQIKDVTYANGLITFKYLGTTSSLSWVGIYDRDETYGHGTPSIAWTYLDKNIDAFSTKTISVNLPSGNYKAILFADNEYVALDTFYFSVP